MVGLLELLGNSLGRENACTIMGTTLQLFFSTFSGVHATALSNGTSPAFLSRQTDKPHTLTSSMKNPSSTSGRSGHKSVEFKSQTEEEGSATGTGKIQPDNLQESEYYKQLSATFSRALVHSSYITFCKLLGQYSLQNILINAELIEQLAYSHDEEARPNSPPVSIFTDPVALDSGTTSDSSDESDDEDEMEEEGEESAVARDAVLKVGPVVALTQLNMEEAGFRKSSWFVDLTENVSEELNATSKDVSHATQTSRRSKLSYLMRGSA